MAANVGKRKFGDSKGALKTKDEDELKLFVDAPPDSDGSGVSDTTDSEDSEYSGLEEEEDTSDEEIADGESDTEVSEEDSDENTDLDVSDENDTSNNNKPSPSASSNSHTKTKALKQRAKLLTKKQAKLSAHEQLMKNEKNNRETVTKQSQQASCDNIATSSTHPVDEYEFDSSDEEDIRNTVGNIPMEWYREYDHIGYDIEGRKLIKPKVGDSLDEFLNKMENPDYWRTVKDRQTGQKVILSDNDIELIRRLRHGKYIDPNYNPYEPWVDFFTHEKSIHPVTNHPPQKRSFIPSKWEKIKVGQMVHAIKMGWIKPRKSQSEEEEDQYYNLWKSDDIDETIRRMRSNIPAPKMSLPGHAESYNPPPEYLFTEEEELAWKEQDPEDRKINFIPRKYSSLRLVPAYSRFINERFERCLDLYLCPRQRKMRMNVNPEDLLPKLPKPKDLQPFPTVQAIVYTGHEGFVRSFSVDPTGQWLCSGSDDKTVRFWEVSTGRCMKTMKVPGIVKCVAWNPNSAFCLVAAAVEETVIILNPELGDKLVMSNTDNMISAYTPPEDLENKTRIPVEWSSYEDSEIAAGLRVKVTHPKAVGKVTWHSRGDYFSVVQEEADSMSVLIHQLSKRRTQNPFKKSKGRVQCVLFHPTRPFFFVATQRYVRVYNLLKQELSKKLMTNVKWVSSMAVHPGGDNLIIGSYDCRLSWFDLDLSNKPYQTLRHHKKAIRAVAYHPKYPLFASASDDGSVIVCHGRVFNDLLQNPLIVPVKVLRGHIPHKQLGVLDCQFHPTQPWVFSSASDCTIRLFS